MLLLARYARSSAKILSKTIQGTSEENGKSPNLIHSDQTGFVDGRYIGQNVRLLNDIMDLRTSSRHEITFREEYTVLQDMFRMTNIHRQLRIQVNR